MVSTDLATSVLNFPVSSFRRIPSPADTKSQHTYVAVVNVYDLPDLSQWRAINVRDPKETGSVPKAIKETLIQDPSMFFFKNRGLVLTAHEVKFDTESSVLTVELVNPKIHGLLDGGHTDKVIKTYCADTARDDSDPNSQAYVRVELLEGFDMEQITDIVEARNTSNQVKDQSLFELEGRFEGIKSAITNTPYADLVAYKEYEIYEGADGPRPKPIDVRELIALLTVFNKDQFGDTNHPVLAYSQRATCLNRFRDKGELFEKIYPLAKDIFDLWDTIQLKLPEWYKAAKSNQGEGARFGRFIGVTTKLSKLTFRDEDSEYAIPTAFKYPILASFRSFLEEDNGKWAWGKGLNPATELENGLGEVLAEVVLSNALEMRNPTKLGKTNSVWDQCYGKSQIWYLRA